LLSNLRKIYEANTNSPGALVVVSCCVVVVFVVDIDDTDPVSAND